MTEPNEPAAGSWGTVALVASREITTRIRTKAFRISTAVLLVGIVAGILISKINSGSSSPDEVGFLPQAASSAPQFRIAAEAVGQKVNTPSVSSREEGEAQLRSGDLDALVTGTANGVQIEAKKDLDDTLRNAFTVLVRQSALNDQLSKAGADPTAVSAAVAAAKLDFHSLERVDPDRGQRLAIGLISGILVYLALMLYGQMVAQGVVEEKTSRIVELLLTAIRPWQLLLGKVIGIGTLGLVQLVAVGVVGIGTGLGTHVLTLPGSVAVEAGFAAFGWFLLGYLMFALMYAGLGALVSRQEDVGGAVAPLTTLIIFPYILGITILPGNPGSPLIKWLSMIPLFSPTLMPMRVASGVPAWQMLTAIVLTIALIAGLVWLAGRIYGNAVTRTGARVRLRDALSPI